MKQNIIFLFMYSMLFVSCSFLDINEPTEDNPLDPDSPNYEPPKTQITSGPADGATVTNASVTFEWQGNQNENSFRYKLDNNDWSNLSQERSATFTELDEGGHTFQVKSIYPSGVEEETPIEISFTVDAVKGPALMFFPRRSIVSNSSTFAVEIIAEEVIGLVGTTILIEFDPARLSLQSIDIYDNENHFLKTNGGEVVVFTDFNNTSGIINIDLGVATANPPGVDGTGALGKITFQTSSVGTSEIKFKEAEFRDADNQAITISERVRGIVEVQ